MSRPLQLLVLDAYAPEGRRALREAGGTEAGILYKGLLERLEPRATVEIVYPADHGSGLPAGRTLADYDGATWTGSSLTILDDEDERVRRQIDLVQALYDAGVPSFGSCWAIQLATVAAGGRCEAHPRGREFGLSRRITLSREGREHPLFRGKPRVFDAFTSHADEVVALAPSATLLASNEWSRVQAISVGEGPGTFWAVQYHPEYDLHELASLCRLRADELVAQGHFADREEAERTIEQLETLHGDPGRRDLVEALGVGDDLLDEELRTLEIRNWLNRAVRPATSSKDPGTLQGQRSLS